MDEKSLVPAGVAGFSPFPRLGQPFTMGFMKITGFTAIRLIPFLFYGTPFSAVVYLVLSEEGGFEELREFFLALANSPSSSPIRFSFWTSSCFRSSILALCSAISRSCLSTVVWSSAFRRRISLRPSQTGGAIKFQFAPCNGRSVPVKTNDDLTGQRVTEDEAWRLEWGWQVNCQIGPSLTSPFGDHIVENGSPCAQANCIL